VTAWNANSPARGLTRELEHDIGRLSETYEQLAETEIVPLGDVDTGIMVPITNCCLVRVYRPKTFLWDTPPQ